MQRHIVKFRETAIADLNAIYIYIAEQSHNPETAIEYIRRIRKKCEILADMPLSGRTRDDLIPGLRMIAFERRVVITYCVEGQYVRITNIFYGGRDYESLYRGD